MRPARYAWTRWTARARAWGWNLPRVPDGVVRRVCRKVCERVWNLPRVAVRRTRRRACARDWKLPRGAGRARRRARERVWNLPRGAGRRIRKETRRGFACLWSARARRFACATRNSWAGVRWALCGTGRARSRRAACCSSARTGRFSMCRWGASSCARFRPKGFQTSAAGARL